MKIAVVGLGYVGLPIAISFAKKTDVIGFDISEEKINLYKEGIDPTKEVGNQSVKETTMSFTTDPKQIKSCNFCIVAVPTPVSSDNTPDLSILKKASQIVGENLAIGTVVVFESTVYPGVTEDICMPILEEASGFKCGKDFFVGYSPERINPGDMEHRLENIVKVVSAQNESILDVVAKTYEMIIEAGVYRASSIKVAEAAKVIENAQRDLNIAFMNELSIIFNKIGVDTKEVLEAAGTKWNFLKFYPGLVGGHCIGVDPYYLTYKAKQVGYNAQVILAGREINDSMGTYVADTTIKKLAKLGKNIFDIKIVILGITFKENCPDIRNTKVVDIVKEFAEYGVKPIISDPYAIDGEVEREYGLNLTPWDEIEEADCIIVAVSHNEFVNYDIESKLCKGGLLVDVKGTLPLIKGRDYWRL